VECVNGVAKVLIDLQANLLLGGLACHQESADCQSDAYQDQGKEKFRA
jgi:hypothetical protein